MSMTHYMGLLASNQPWNLTIFMAIPVILAETIAITELYLLLTRNYNSKVKSINKWAGITVGIYFLGVFLYLFKTAVIPITMAGEWRGFADVIAVGFYLLGVVPLFGIALLELGFIKKNKSDDEKLKLHVIFVAVFLVVAHIAMIFGMVDPDIYSNKSTTMPMEMSN
jgi:hypothetical protein